MRRNGKELLAQLLEVVGRISQQQTDTADTERILVNKRTHLIRYEDETEETVTIVIEKRGDV
ncbi:MAG TPA: hypothetical protein VGV59_04065 [Pyrinomonadaceae bacterium]|nr:hypothetical protein [Pyrinomonadaceae bacterium]